MTISDVYLVLPSLVVELEMSPELGTSYLKRKLLECHQKQNQISEILVDLTREYSASVKALRAQEQLQVLKGKADPTYPVEIRRHHELVEMRDDLRCALTVVGVRRQNLARTSSDIRLMAKIVADMLKWSPAGTPSSPSQPVEPPDPTGPVLDDLTTIVSPPVRARVVEAPVPSVPVQGPSPLDIDAVLSTL